MRKASIVGEVGIGISVISLSIIQPYIAPAVGALFVYLYLYTNNKIEFNLKRLFLSVLIGGVVGFWLFQIVSETAIYANAIDRDFIENVGSALGGLFGFLSPHFLEWLASKEKFEKFMGRIIK